MSTVAIVYHSGYGHTQALAEAVAKGAQAVPGVKASLVPGRRSGGPRGRAGRRRRHHLRQPDLHGRRVGRVRQVQGLDVQELDGRRVAEQARRRLHRLGVVERRQAEHALPAPDARPAARHGVGRPRPAAGLQPFQGLGRRPQPHSAPRSAPWRRPMPTRATRASPRATSAPWRRSASGSPKRRCAGRKRRSPRRRRAASLRSGRRQLGTTSLVVLRRAETCVSSSC